MDGAGKVLLPGFVNAHTHLPMTLMRGYGGGCDLHTWLNQYIFPAEARLDSRAVAAGAGLGLAEMIASGVTCVADMYMRTGTIAEQILDAGISANLSCGGVYFGAPRGFLPETCGDCRNQAALTEGWHGAGAARSWWTPRSTGSTPPIPLCGGGWPSTPQSTDWGCTSTSLRPSRSTRPAWSGGARPPSRPWTAAVCGTAAALAAHCVYTTEEDWALMAEKGISCVHNPWSNLKLGSGVAPIPAMLRAGERGPGHRWHVLPQQCRSLLRYQAGRRPAQRGGAGPHGRECLQAALEMATVNGARPWAGIPGSSPRERRRT